MRISHNTNDLAVAALRAFGTDSEQVAEQASEAAHDALKADYKSLYDALVSGSIDFFYCESEPSRIGRASVQVWTRSARSGVAVQRTSFLKICASGELVALSHHDISVFSDLVEDSMPDNVDIMTA